MATAILRTTAGAAHDHAVRNGTAAGAALQHIVLLDGTPVTDVLAIQALTTMPGTEVHRFTRRSAEDCDFALTEERSTITRYEATLPEAMHNIRITGIALLLENGVLWGYAPYLVGQGGLLKTAAFGWSLNFVIAETDNTLLDFTYEPLDYRVMRDRLLTDIRTELNIPGILALLATAANDLRLAQSGKVFNCNNLVDMLSQIATFDPISRNLTFACPNTPPVDPPIDPPPVDPPIDPPPVGTTSALVTDPTTGVTTVNDGLIPSVSLSVEYPNLIVTATDQASLNAVALAFPNIEITI